MIHPHTELRRCSDSIGYGVFATAFIPKGTIVYVKDPLEIDLSPAQYDALDPAYRAITDKYSYVDPLGHRIISWDTAKYVNHRCGSNTLSAGYGFELAVVDIHPDEEITDEYGLLNITEPMQCACASPICRGVVRGEDIDLYFGEWDERVRPALHCMNSVTQPLLPFMDRESYTHLTLYLNGREGYRSVAALRLLPQPAMAGAVRSRPRL